MARGSTKADKTGAVASAASSPTRLWSTKGGFAREDSDDELGDVDLPWEWIHQRDQAHEQNQTDGGEERDVEHSSLSSRKRKQRSETYNATPKRNRGNRGNDSDRTIVGARMGDFSVRVGDAVLLKSPEQGRDWAGLVAAFSDTNEDDEQEMCAWIMWFCSPEELEASGLASAPASTSAAAVGGRITERQQQQPRKSASRARTLPPTVVNESFITADFNMNPLTAINGTAIVLSEREFERRYPNGRCPKGKAAAARFAKTIMCRRGVKQRNLRFTDIFDWKDQYTGPSDLLALLDYIKENTKQRRPKVEDGEFDTKAAGSKRQRQDDNVNVNVGDDEDVDMGSDTAPTTPKKKRKTSTAASTPKSSVKSTKFITPTAKRIMVKKPLEITPLGTRILSPFRSHGKDFGSGPIAPSPYTLARSTLHVSAVPLSLPCRTNEFDTVYSYLHAAIDDGSGTCIYISGTPGTGKTATVREVVASLHAAVQADELDAFNFVEINGMKVTEPTQSYSLLWEALKGDRVSPANALHLLEHEFTHPRPGRIPCVVLMDELDQLVTKSQSVMYNFFNWPGLRHSRLIVLAVANTMDLPERTLSNKISSRLGLTRITFPGYTHPQLMEIISSRLEGVVGTDGTAIVDSDAVQFAARKVAAVSGDARRALDICRRAVEIAEQQHRRRQQEETSTPRNGHGEDEEMEEEAEIEQARTPSKTGRGVSRGPAVESEKGSESAMKSVKKKLSKDNVGRNPRVTIATIKAAITEATSSPVHQHLRSLALACKLFLAALLARTRRTGVPDATLGDVLLEARRLASVSESQAIHDFLVLDSLSLTSSSAISAVQSYNKDVADGTGIDETSRTKYIESAAPRILALGAAAMELVESGIITLDAHARARGDRAGKVRLRLGDEEVRAALMGDSDCIGLGFN